VDLGERVIEFVKKRKISFDGQCYHSRIPLKIIKFLEECDVKPDSVQWEGIWGDGKIFHVVLTFGKKKGFEKPSKNSTEDDDYIVLQE
jgi:hypothetical protein